MVDLENENLHSWRKYYKVYSSDLPTSVCMNNIHLGGNLY